MLTPSVSTTTIYHVPNFDIFSKFTNFVVFDSLPFNDNIGSVNNINISYDNFDELLELSDKSKVGINNDTVYNEDYRKSNEILADKINLSTSFINFVNNFVEQHTKEFGKIKLYFYKLILYDENDYFKSHIDAEHRPNILFTLSVQLPCEEPTLIVNKEPIPCSEDGNLSLALFYTDLPHSVPQLPYRRISLIFDCCEDTNYVPEFPEVNQAIQTFKDLNINKIGIIMNHVFFSDFRFKGVDRWIKNCFKDFKTELMPITIERGYLDVKIYPSDVLNLLSESEAFESLYFKSEDLPKNKNVEIKTKDIKEFEPEMDTQSYWVKDNYKLGDIAIISINNDKLKGIIKYFPNEEAHLGNEGFYGKIYENMLLIVYL